MESAGRNMTQTATEQDVHVGLCWECGYALNGLPTPRCPECGRAFDPANPATMNMGRHVGGLAGRLLRPPGWPLYTMTAVAVLLSLWAACFPMPPGQIAPMLMHVWRGATVSTWVHVLCSYANTETRYAYAVLAWLAVAAVWTVRRVARGVTIRRIAPGQRAAPFAYWRRWLIPHFVLVATILFCRTSGPVFVGFYASKPAIESARRNWTGNPPMGRSAPLRRTTRWVGVYPVEGYTGLWATHGGPGMDMVNASDFGGFVYAPGGRPAGYRGYEVRYVGSGWYSIHKADVYR
jgi:hypothetical protein